MKKLSDMELYPSRLGEKLILAGLCIMLLMLFAAILMRDDKMELEAKIAGNTGMLVELLQDIKVQNNEVITLMEKTNGLLKDTKEHLKRIKDTMPGVL